jgi:hypothetical protein
MSHIIEAGIPHVAMGYGVWICDQFADQEGFSLLHPELNCTTIKTENKTDHNPSLWERKATCSVIDGEIKAGVMSPNMQVLLIEQIDVRCAFSPWVLLC